MGWLMIFIADAGDTIIQGAQNACGNACNQNPLTVVFANLANTLTFIVGAVSVIMIIIGGLRYAIAQGDSKAVEAAKNTILYAVIGVVVAIVAFGVVNFVQSSLTGSGGAKAKPTPTQTP